MVAPAAAAAAAAAPRIAGEVIKTPMREIFKDVVIAGLGANFLPSVSDILNAVAGRGTPQGMEGRPPAASTGKFIVDPSVIADYQQKYNQEMFNRAKIAAIPFIGPSLISQLPELPTPEEFAQSLREGAEMQMEGATERKMKERAQELQAEILKTQIERGALRDIAELQGLANVQQERLKGSYGLAQGVLENAIENVLKSGTITDRSAETALAAIQ